MIKNFVLEKCSNSITTPFTYFDKRECANKNGEIKKVLMAVHEDVNISFLCQFIENILAKIIHHRNVLLSLPYAEMLDSVTVTE